MQPKIDGLVLITGSSGYIGRHLRRLLDQRGVPWIGIDLAKESGPLADKCFCVDILDTASVAQLIRDHNVKYVVHLAGLAFVGESFERSEEYMRVNVRGTSSILNAIQGYDLKGFVFASSCSVYGSGNHRFKESAPMRPQSPYAESKVKAERLLLTRANEFSLVILRFFNVVGGQGDGVDGDNHVPEPHVLPNLIYAGITGKPFTVFGSDFETVDGSAVREYVDVRDISRALFMSLKAIEICEKHSSKIYNLGSEEPYSILQLSRLVAKHTGPISIRYSDRRPGDPDSAQSSSNKATQELGWSPLHSISDSIEAQIAFMRSSGIVHP